MVESAIGTHLINNAITEHYQLYYWRENNLEVDFILEKQEKCIAIEVKSGRRGENAGISVFAKKYHPKKVLLIGTGGIPVEDFLRLNPTELF